MSTTISCHNCGVEIQEVDGIWYHWTPDSSKVPCQKPEPTMEEEQ